MNPPVITLDLEHHRATVNGRAYRVVPRKHVYWEAHGECHEGVATACTGYRVEWTEVTLPHARCTLLAYFDTEGEVLPGRELVVAVPGYRRVLRALYGAWKATQ